MSEVESRSTTVAAAAAFTFIDQRKLRQCVHPHVHVVDSSTLLRAVPGAFQVAVTIRLRGAIDTVTGTAVLRAKGQIRGGKHFRRE